MSSSESDKKPKNRACTECHKSKSRCVYPPDSDRCERCIRLNKVCTPHVSRQGKRKSIDSTSDQQQLTGPMAAALAMRNSNVANFSNQLKVMDMLQNNNDVSAGLSNNGGTANLLGNHGMMGAANSGNSFNSMDLNLNTHHLAEQIQKNMFFAKNNGLLQQQQQQQQQQQSYQGDSNGLNTILSRAMGDNRNKNNMGVASLADNISSGNNFGTNTMQGLPGNLFSGMNPMTLNQIANLNNNMNDKNGNGGNVGGNNLDLLYQAVNSQQKNKQQQGLLGLTMAGGNEQSATLSNSMNGSSSNIPHHLVNGGNSFNKNNLMMFSQGNNSNISIGKAKTALSPQQPSLNNGNNIGNSTKSMSQMTNRGGNKTNIGNADTPTTTNQMRASDSRLKKQKKHHKYYPPEYPPISLLNSHSVAGTPSSSQAGDGNLSRSSSTQNFITPEDAIGSHYMNACARNSGLTLTGLKNHYGLQCQIREWISMALARRSFALLSKASSLAHRCSMHMDRILSGLDDENYKDGEGKKKCAGPRMHYLLSMLLEPQSKIRIPIEDRHMLLPHFPPAFLNVIGCQNGQFFQESEIRNRWIIVRETRCGISRFFCSPAFERNVLCWAHVSQIYEDNLADIHSLIFVKDQFRRFLACNAYQIWSHSEEGMPPRPVHAPKTRIRLLSKRWGQASYQDDGVTNPITKTMIQQVDDVMTLEMDLVFVSFPTMDKTTYYLEFFYPAKNDSSPSLVGNSSNPGALPNAPSDNRKPGARSPDRQRKSSDSFSTNPPTFDDIMESEEWVGIDDVMASGDINDLMDALLD